MPFRRLLFAVPLLLSLISLLFIPLLASSEEEPPSFLAKPICQSGMFIGIIIQTTGPGIFKIGFPSYNPCLQTPPEPPAPKPST